jgi:hypothetical protein
MLKERDEMLEQIKSLAEIGKNAEEILRSNISHLEDLLEDETISEEDKNKIMADLEESQELLRQSEQHEGNGILTDEERKEIKRMGEIQTFLQDLERMHEEEENEEIRPRIEKQIRYIKSSYTLEILSTEITVTARPKTILNNFSKYRKHAVTKMKNNPKFTFHAPERIESKLASVLEDPKDAKLLAGFFYGMIGTLSLKPDGYAMFVYFLIKNINALDGEFTEKEELIGNLNSLVKKIKNS